MLFFWVVWQWCACASDDLGLASWRMVIWTNSAFTAVRYVVDMSDAYSSRWQIRDISRTLM
jgi:hypothetical protein